MPAIYSYPTLSDPVSKYEIETNFSNISSKFGNLTSADLAPGAGITPSQLTKPYQEQWVSLRYAGGAGWPAANTICDSVAIPGVSGDVTWEMTDVIWNCVDTGDSLGKFSIVWGAWTAGPAFTVTTTFVNGASISNLGAANDNSQGYPLSGGSSSLAFGTTPGFRSLALMSHTVSAATLSAAGSYLQVSVCLKRYLTTSP